jgi:hypothetical protein
VFLKLNQRLNILKTKYHNSQLVAASHWGTIALGQAFSEFSGFSCQFSFHQLLHSLTHSWGWALLEKLPIAQPLKK